MTHRLGIRRASASGFSLVELLAVMTTIGIISAIAIPLFGNMFDSMRLSASVRDVDRELQTARLKAVSAKRPIRVRFNCPATGSFRMVEIIGTPGSPATADSAADRCNTSLYPYPSASRNLLVRPNNDGPARLLQPGAAFTVAQTIEFWPDGSAHAAVGATNPWPVIPSGGVNITVTRKGISKSITVNGVGKIQIQ
jgi:prepilin-type N-terminal cleavage/methylation domain-containing protein